MHLVTQTGLVIEPQFRSKDRYSFIIPRNVDTVYLASKTSRPSDSVGLFIDDRRELGVLVGEMFIITHNSSEKLSDYLYIDDLQGWDVVEQAPCRWTNGYARMNIGQNSEQQRVLVVQVISTSWYHVDEQTVTAKIA